jgi:hypothetical protein
MSRVIPLALAAISLAACVDRPPTQKPAEVPLTGPSLSADATGAARSSVCVAWDGELADLRTAAEANPTDADTREAIVAYEARIQETCN